MFTRQQAQEIHRIINSENRDALDAYITSNNINVNEIDEHNDTMLHMAVRSRKKEIIKFLVEEKNVKIDPKNNQKQTPLYIATSANNDDELVLYLIEHGANRKIIINSGENVLGDSWKHQLCWDSYRGISQKVEELDGQHTADSYVAIKRHKSQIELLDKKVNELVHIQQNLVKELDEYKQKIQAQETELAAQKVKSDGKDKEIEEIKKAISEVTKKLPSEKNASHWYSWSNSSNHDNNVKRKDSDNSGQPPNSHEQPLLQSSKLPKLN